MPTQELTDVLARLTNMIILVASGMGGLFLSLGGLQYMSGKKNASFKNMLTGNLVKNGEKNLGRSIEI